MTGMMEIREPTTDRGLQPAVMDKTELAMRTERDITPEPEPLAVSDQVHEPTTLCVAKGMLVEFEG